jgi:hypothetical protein
MNNNNIEPELLEAMKRQNIIFDIPKKNEIHDNTHKIIEYNEIVQDIYKKIHNLIMDLENYHPEPFPNNKYNISFIETRLKDEYDEDIKYKKIQKLKENIINYLSETINKLFTL